MPLAGLGWDDLLAPVPLGIALGLLLGKLLGVYGFIWLCLRLGWATFDRTIRPAALFGMAALCGIGFTMSLFVGSLSFGADHPDYQLTHRLGILSGSLFSALLGFAVLKVALPSPEKA